MSEFHEQAGEKEGQRRKRFLEFLRSLPKPNGIFDPKKKVWIPNEEKKK
jgi:hypothetical protein